MDLISIDIGFFYILFVVFFFSFLQSFLGIGLLIFGTPTLLLLGYEYSYVLSIILPCSIALSFLQSYQNLNKVYGAKYLYVYTLPSLSIGLLIILNTSLEIDIIKMIGLILFIITIIRINKKLNHFFHTMVNKYTVIYSILIGLIHGFFNMSGAFLAIFMSTTNKSAAKARVSIAYWYLIFALIQTIILIITNNFYFSYLTIFLILISIISHLFVNFTILKKINNKIFQKIVTLVVFSYSLFCLLS